MVNKIIQLIKIESSNKQIEICRHTYKMTALPLTYNFPYSQRYDMFNLDLNLKAIHIIHRKYLNRRDSVTPQTNHFLVPTPPCFQLIYSYQTIEKHECQLTQTTPVVFVVNSIIMTTFWGAGYSIWGADTANPVVF